VSHAKTSSDFEDRAAESISTAEVHDDFEADGYGAGIEPGRFARWTPLLVTSVVLFWAYASEFSWLWEIWSLDPNYSHGYFVIPVALWILWRRLKDTEEEAQEGGSWPWHLGWLILIALLVARAFFHHRGYRWSDSATLVPVIACLVLTLGGWELLRRVWPAVIFLLFMMPLPNKVNDLLAQPLQSIATRASVSLLKSSGLWVLNEGNVIYLGQHPIFVAEACNGLSMLMTLAATLTAAMFLFSIPLWMRALLGLSIIPIALASNIVRIFATAWCFQRFGVEAGGRIAHETAGWLMMPLALAMALIEVKLLSWLVVEDGQDAQPLLLGRPIVARDASQSRPGISNPLASEPRIATEDHEREPEHKRESESVVEETGE
jgi:exosortase